jgi:hypothetical protein
VLRDAGCVVWDLGGVNMCPLMRYKLDLTGCPIERMAAMHTLTVARNHRRRGLDGSDSRVCTGAETTRRVEPLGLHLLKPGILVADINYAHLLSADS